MAILWMGQTDRQIKAKNDETYEVAEQVFRSLEENSDLMMRYSHFTKPHRKTIPLCPECGSGIEDKFVPTSVDLSQEDVEPMDLHRDAKEIHEMMRSVHTTLLMQRMTLKHHLTALRDAELFENAKPFEDAWP